MVIPRIPTRVKVPVSFQNYAPLEGLIRGLAAKRLVNLTLGSVKRVLAVPEQLSVLVDGKLAGSFHNPITHQVQLSATQQTAGAVRHEVGHAILLESLMATKQGGLVGDLRKFLTQVGASLKQQSELSARLIAMGKEFDTLPEAAQAATRSKAEQDVLKVFGELQKAQAAQQHLMNSKTATKTLPRFKAYDELFADATAVITGKDPKAVAKAANDLRRDFTQPGKVKVDEKDIYYLLQPFRSHLYQHYLKKPGSDRGDVTLLKTLADTIWAELGAQGHRAPPSPRALNLRLIQAFDEARGTRTGVPRFTVTPWVP